MKKRDCVNAQLSNDPVTEAETLHERHHWIEAELEMGIKESHQQPKSGGDDGEEETGIESVHTKAFRSRICEREDDKHLQYHHRYSRYDEALQ